MLRSHTVQILCAEYWSTELQFGGAGYSVGTAAELRLRTEQSGAHSKQNEGSRILSTTSKLAVGLPKGTGASLFGFKAAGA